jgi:mono/diheme cytochrome c family protein
MNARPIALALLTVTLTSAHAADPPGRQVYEKWCAPCHAPGPGHPGTAALAVLYGSAKPGALEQRDDLTAPFISAVVRQGVYSMPFFRKTEISDEELATLAAYLARSAK